MIETNSKILGFLILLALLASTDLAQLTRKPSPSREPVDGMPAIPASEKRSLPELRSRKEFDLMARVYHKGTPFVLPHVMFIIDRRAKDRIYYVNSQKYRFHKDFLVANYLVLKGSDFFQDTYIKQNRRFIVGTIAYQKPVSRFTFEFWEGDLIPAEQIRFTGRLINRTFFEKVAFKPNSLRQDTHAKGIGIERITSDQISKNQEYLALNTARSVGRVHIVGKLDDTVEIGYNEILVLSEVPITLPPVAGIIVTKQSTPLSHINLLAKGWGIPNAYIKNADVLFRELDGRWIEFETKLTSYEFKPAGNDVLRSYLERQKVLGRVFEAPPSDLAKKTLATLTRLRKRDSISYGAKAANLGEVKSARIRRVTVPRGFTVPFHYYDNFFKKHGFEERVAGLLDDRDFVHNPRVRRSMLSKLRADMQNAPMDERLKKELVRKWRSLLAGKGVFVRSSSNAEDMPNFSGAGLYTTVPNVKTAEALAEAVKTVWASLWNFEAFEARERGFIKHIGTYMAVLVQVGVDMDSSGVLITKDPFDGDNKNAVYISAKRGLGIKVVEGKKVAEQLLISRKSNSVQVLTRSGEDTLLTFDESGGVKEVPIVGTRNVLTDSVARRLAGVGQRIKRVFGGRVDQDIEWGYKAGRIFILQSRPFIEN